MKDLKPRIVGAVLYALFMLICAHFGSWVLLTGFLLCSLALNYELSHLLVEEEHSTLSFISFLIVIGTFALLLWAKLPEQRLIMIALVTIAWQIWIFYQTTILRRKPSIFSASLFYIAIPLCLVVSFFEGSEIYNPAVLFLLFYLIWINDVMAYFVGRTLGRHALAPKISPNKTIEGSLGGLILTLTGLPLILQFLNFHMSTVWIITGIVTIIAGSLGDLFESQMKRLAGVKDSGRFIPGHGGLLDRMDSLLFAIPVYILCHLIFL